MAFERDTVGVVCDLLRRSPPLLHILVGARQVGKTTVANQVLKRFALPSVYASADAALPPGPEWVETHWSEARRRAASTRRPVILALDEIQKVRGWSEEVKRLWDEDRRRGTRLHVLLLGSSALLLQKGLSESLVGRFFLHRCPHWSWDECRRAFGWDLDRWIFYGGYPGAAPMTRRPSRWRQYVADSLVETVLARDVLQLQTVAKPALLRHLFALAATFPAQVFSYNKMLGQLQDAGNTTTLAHYLKLLETAFLVSGLELYSAGQRRQRGSSPKLVLWNPALITALSGKEYAATRRDPAWWGRLVENAVGAHLLNHLHGAKWTLAYWREGPLEVDYVVGCGARVWVIEIKSGRSGRAFGLAAFLKKYPRARPLLVGGNGLPLETFFGADPCDLLR